MSNAAKKGHASSPPIHLRIKSGAGSKARSAPGRVVAITNQHPRLRLDRRAITRAIHLLDANFEVRAADIGYLSANRGRLSEFQSQIKKRKSNVPPACPAGELSLVFLTDPALAKIHGDFMDDPTATDVITFEGDVAAGLAGEICVSADTAWNYVAAAAPGRRQPGPASSLLQRFSAELTLYVVHGWLHLAGYDDLQPAKKRRMRAAEARAMDLLRAANAVPQFELA